MPDTLTISLMGSPQIALNGRPCTFSSAKAIALLAYLAVSGMRHERAELAVLLWPESDNKRARGALRYTLSTIKKEIGGEFLLVDRRHIGLSDQADWGVDVHEMRRLLAPALAGENGLVKDHLVKVEKGIALYQADFLHGFTLRDSAGFNEWAFIQGEALRRDLATALKRLAAHYQALRQWETAVTHAHRWLNLDPLHEPAHRQLMQLYAELKEWTAVHNQYQSLTDLLEKDLGAPPLPETTAHYQQLCQQRAADASTGSASVALVETPDQRSRRVLIEKVRRFWVDGLLAPLHNEQTFINLKLECVNETINHPWDDVLDGRHNADAANIYRAFRNADRALLILGAPGAGKTINLVELANYLLAMADEDEHQPIPVILNLSSWAEKQLPIGEWAVEEMIAKYQMPRRIGRSWLADDRLLFLLDGLDEMPSERRPNCIAAINDFRQTHGLADLAVCCRQAAYEIAVHDDNARLQLNGAVLIRPLTTTQIRQYAPPSLVEAIFEDEALLEIAQSPLNLNMMQTAFNGRHGESPETTTFTRSALFDQYVQRMFERQQTKRGNLVDTAELSAQLSWLARQMGRHNQSLFLIEQMQPSWLGNDSHAFAGNGRLQWLYLFLSHTGIPVVLGTLINWSFIQLIGFNPPYIKIHFLTQFSAIFGITTEPINQLFSLFWLNVGAALLATMTSGLFFLWRQRRGDEARIDQRLGGLQLLLESGAAWTAVTIPLLRTDELPLALFFGGMAAFGQILTFGGLQYGQSFQTEIRIRGALKWSWRNAFILGAVGGTLSLIWSAIIWLRNPAAVEGMTNLLNMGLFFFLLGGLTDKRTEIRNRPNEGMWIAAQNGLKAALVTGVPSVLLTAVTVNLYSGLHTGLVLGILAGTVHGFNDLLKHFILRLLLWRGRHVPLNYAQLLDCAADCVLLQKVGGGYTFRHRLLLDHFAQNAPSHQHESARAASSAFQ